MLKEAELFSEFSYPFSPEQITLFFVYLIGWVWVWPFTNGVGQYFSHECSLFYNNGVV